MGNTQQVNPTGLVSSYTDDTIELQETATVASLPDTEGEVDRYAEELQEAVTVAATRDTEGEHHALLRDKELDLHAEDAVDHYAEEVEDRCDPLPTEKDHKLIAIAKRLKTPAHRRLHIEHKKVYKNLILSGQLLWTRLNEKPDAIALKLLHEHLEVQVPLYDVISASRIGTPPPKGDFDTRKIKLKLNSHKLKIKIVDKYRSLPNGIKGLSVEEHLLEEVQILYRHLVLLQNEYPAKIVSLYTRNCVIRVVLRGHEGTLFSFRTKAHLVHFLKVAHLPNPFEND